MKLRLLSLLLILCTLLSFAACTETPPPVTEQTTSALGATEEPLGVALRIDDASYYQVVLDAEITESTDRAAKRVAEALRVWEYTTPDKAWEYGKLVLRVQAPEGEGAHPMDHTLSIGEELITITACHEIALFQAVEAFLRATVLAADSVLYYTGETAISYSYLAAHDSEYGLLGYEFYEDAAGFAEGRILLYFEYALAGNLYWGDERGALEDYSAILKSLSVDGGKLTTVEIPTFTAIPEGATRLLVLDGSKETVGSYELPTYRLLDGDPMYSFGAISDSHQGDRYGSTALPYDHFVNAIRILNEKNCSLVGICGDFTYDNELWEYQMHVEAIQECYGFAPGMPIYTVAGNHESKYTGFDEERFLRYSRDLVDYHTDLLPKYFDDNRLDYVIELPDGSVMIYLNQVYYDYGNTTSRLLTDEQLDWLGARLEQYKNKTVFLFFHTFLDEEVGDGSSIGGGEYSLPLIEGTVDHTRLTAYLKKYTNVVYFSGHSHLSFDTQFITPKPGKTNHDVNIDDKDGTYATMVHIPSVAAPRTLSEYTSSLYNATDRSEGYIVHVYKTCIVLEGYDFVNGQTLSYATYIIEK